MKKFLTMLIFVVALTLLVGCNKATKKGLEVIKIYNAQEISKWSGSITPGETKEDREETKGTVEFSESKGVAIIKAPVDNWGGGIETPIMTFDFTETIYMAVRVNEVNDAFKWTVKFVPDNPVEGHEWGFYVFEDNQAKYNNYLMANLNEKLSQDVINAYGGKEVSGKFWIWAVGPSGAELEISEIVFFKGSMADEKLYTALEISKWTGSITPGETKEDREETKGIAEFSESKGVAIIKAPTDNWGGGIETPIMTFDFTQTIYMAIRINEVNDAFKWTVKFVPDNPVEGHEWGFYVFEDNQVKYNNYLMANLNEKLSQDVINAYGGKEVSGKFWIWAVGPSGAELEVSEIVFISNFK